jgi:hypothetical protein
MDQPNGKGMGENTERKWTGRDEREGRMEEEGKGRTKGIEEELKNGRMEGGGEIVLGTMLWMEGEVQENEELKRRRDSAKNSDPRKMNG